MKGLGVSKAFKGQSTSCCNRRCLKEVQGQVEALAQVQAQAQV